MWPILKAALRTGVVTRSLAALEQPAPGFRGRPVLDAGGCDGDGACAAACPSQAIVIQAVANGDKLYSLDYGACVFCGRCVDACGARALTLSGEYMLSVSRRADLVFTALLLGQEEARR